MVLKCLSNKDIIKFSRLEINIQGRTGARGNKKRCDRGWRREREVGQDLEKRKRGGTEVRGEKVQ